MATTAAAETTSPTTNKKTRSCLTHLECSMSPATQQQYYSANEFHNLSPASQRPLLARYDLNKAKETLTRESLANRRDYSLWRYEEVLPVLQTSNIVSLGRKEGWTTIHFADRLGNQIGCPSTYIKDESTNPTGSFKARGLCMAVSKALEIMNLKGGTKRALSIPSAGNAAGALSAYAAKAGLEAFVYMPQDVPKLFVTECQQLGATVTLVDGLIHDCGKRAKEDGLERGWFDVSTLKEPYRLEGKKTMGYELAEQFGWDKLPDVIIYPTGGGTGLVGMWKAFEEMEALGLLDASVTKRPRMVSVQSTGCAPIVKAFQAGTKHATLWENAHTVADGLRVPVAVGDFLILQALRESGGTAVSVTDDEMIHYTRVMGAATGIFPAPEGAACLAAQVKLLKEGWIQPQETVLLFNTGSGLKYHHVYE